MAFKKIFNQCKVHKYIISNLNCFTSQLMDIVSLQMKVNKFEVNLTKHPKLLFNYSWRN